MVWIYLANETSPLVTYRTMIPEIRGKHFRLNDEQWKHLCKQFDIDGIPSYVVVDRDGSYRLRNDLRDHSALVATPARDARIACCRARTLRISSSGRSRSSRNSRATVCHRTDRGTVSNRKRDGISISKFRPAFLCPV